MKVLIVAPSMPNISSILEIPAVASGNRPTILSGLITVDHLALTLQQQQYQIIHFMQHGSYGILQMSDGMLNDEQLVRMLKNQTPCLQLVFLNACNSAGLAARLHNELRVATLAHEAPIDDRLAVVYAREFYKALHATFDLHAADEAAYRSLEVEAKMAKLDYVRPILNNGDMVTLNVLELAVAALQREQARMANTLAELIRWVRVVVPSALAMMALLVLLAYLAPR